MNAARNRNLLECVRDLESKESILDGISDILMLLDAQTYEILDVNQAFLDLYGTTRDQVIGKKCHQITHHFSRPCSTFGHSQCPLEQIAKTGAPFRTQHKHRSNVGESLHLEINAYPLKDEDGKVIRIIHMAKDVTRQKEAEDALKQQLTRSEHLAALGQLVAEITHEIKNPLMMIGGFANQLLKSVEGEKQVKQLTIITEEVARLEKLLRDLREYHLPKGTVRKELHVNEVMESIHALVKDECAKKHIRSELILNQGDMIINWDPDQLTQVLVNIVKNSIEAMDEGGTLTIKTELAGDKVKLVISDNGCGIPQKNVEKVLECYYTTKSYGTGLGLCISKKYVDEHEGSALRVSSEENKGTTVEIDIPIFQGWKYETGATFKNQLETSA